MKYSEARDGRHDMHFESFSSFQTRDVSLFMCKIHMQETQWFYYIKVLKRAVGVVVVSQCSVFLFMFKKFGLCVDFRFLLFLCFYSIDIVKGRDPFVRD